MRQILVCQILFPVRSTDAHQEGHQIPSSLWHVSDPGFPTSMRIIVHASQIPDPSRCVVHPSLLFSCTLQYDLCRGLYSYRHSDARRLAIVGSVLLRSDIEARNVFYIDVVLYTRVPTSARLPFAHRTLDFLLHSTSVPCFVSPPVAFRGLSSWYVIPPPAVTSQPSISRVSASFRPISQASPIPRCRTLPIVAISHRLADAPSTYAATPRRKH